MQQRQQNQSMQMRSDSISRDFFAPRVVLANGEEIALSEEQRAAIQHEAGQAADSFAGLRFDLDSALRRLIGLANQHPVEEDPTVAQLEQVLDIERQIKVLQLRMALRVKNLLTLEQQEQLLQIRRNSRLRGERQPR
jgi:hypothetical protein